MPLCASCPPLIAQFCKSISMKATPMKKSSRTGNKPARAGTVAAAKARAHRALRQLRTILAETDLKPAAKQATEQQKIRNPRRLRCGHLIDAQPTHQNQNTKPN